MSLHVQMGFWQDKVLADTRHKLTELYSKNPHIADSEKRTVLEYWQQYDGLTQVLSGRLQSFISWFQSATSPETITRCLRALKEDGTIKLSNIEKKRRQEREQSWRRYWSRQENGEGKSL